MNRKLNMSFGTGAPVILLVFVVLCLTVLASLSLMTALSDFRLTEKSADYTAAYYAADSAAEAWLAEVDAGLSRGTLPESVTASFPVTDRQALQVTISVTDGRLRLLEEKLTAVEVWDYDEHLPQFSDVIVE